MNPPVFLLAPARSYSTVSLALLSGHPDVFGFPEMLMFSEETVGEVLESRIRRPGMPEFGAQMRLNGVCRAIAEIHEGGQSEGAVARAGAWLRARGDWTTVRLMKYLLDAIDPLIGLETTTEEALRRCTTGFPDARFIHLTRHPVTTQRSMREHWRFRYQNRRNEFWSAACASAWYLHHRYIMRELSTLPAEQWIRVRAEDLLREPEKSVPPIYDWLGLDYDDEIIANLAHTERWRFAGTGESGKLRGGDPKFMLDPRLRPVAEPGPVEFPAEWNLLEEMCHRMTELAAELGY
jgi:hypothetical protein